MKHHLKFIVLHILSKHPLSGYTLMQEIRIKTKCWKPSTGSIYPLLIGMEHEGLLSSKKQGRSTLYLLTDKGKAELKKLTPTKGQIIEHLVHHFQILSSLVSKKEYQQFVKELIEVIGKQ